MASEAKEGRVVALESPDMRNEDAIGFLTEAVCDPQNEGVCVIVFGADGHETRCFGSIARSQLVYACARLQRSVLEQD